MKPEDTLETPGTIAILGAGPIGIEAALYGRYLGYQVTLFESKEPCSSLEENRMAPAPEHCSSPLGNAALAAQRTGRGSTTVEIEARTIGEWLDNYWGPLLRTDLLEGRIRSGATIEEIRLVPMEESGEEEEGTLEEETQEELADDEVDGDLPEDFLVVWKTADGVEQSERFEAILDARGKKAPWIGPGAAPWIGTDAAPWIGTGAATDNVDQLPPYLAWIGSRRNDQSDYLSGLVDIREVFAILSGRPNLDVYRNLGG